MIAVITGATKGIGRAISETFAAAGYDIVACARTEADLQAMKDEFALRFPRIAVHTKAADLGDVKQVEQVGKWLLNAGHIPDILVNNAGYFIPGSIYNEKEGTLEKMIEMNVYSAYHLTRYVLPALMERKSGHIFNMCSIASFQPLPNVGSYGISKFALLGFTKHLREEMKPFGIKVTAVLPGATLTSSWDGVNIDAPRIMEASDIAKMVFTSSQLSPQAVVEDIIIRPQLGDV